MTRAEPTHLTELAEGLVPVIHTGHNDADGWFACWCSADPDATADYFRHRVRGYASEAEAVVAFLDHERSRLERLETVADLVRQLEDLINEPAYHKISEAVWQELTATIAELDAEDNPPAATSQCREAY